MQNILEGSVRKSGNRIRVTAQLINTADESHLWSQRFDQEMTDVFAIQDEISQAIAEKLRVRLAGEGPLIKRHTENVEAYNLYLRGRYYLYRATAEHFAKSKECFEQAVAMDFNYALAWHGLAMYYWFLGYRGFTVPIAANGKSIQAAQKALRIDEMLPEAHSMMAVLWASEFDWNEAEREFRRALELDPNSAEVWQNYSRYFLVPMRRLDEAVAASQKAVELDPLAPSLQYELGQRYWLMRRYDQAIDQFRNALELDPQLPWAHMLLGYSYVQTGRFDEGIQSCQMGIQLSGRSTLLLGVLGCALTLAGRAGEARKLLAEMQELALKTYVSPFGFACIYVELGELDKSMEWLERAIDERDAMVFQIHVHPQYSDLLRSHPRYHALLRKMKLEP